jgi:uncharacterized repeat protein (TIGR02543 family)
MKMTFNKVGLALAMSALLGLAAPASLALASPVAIPLDGASTFSTWSCEPNNLGFGNLNFATLEFSQGLGTNNACETITGYASSAFNAADGYVYSTDLYEPVISRVDVRGNPVYFNSSRTMLVTGFNGNNLKLAINPRTGDAFIVADSTLRTLDLATGSGSDAVALDFSPYALAYSPSGSLYGVDSQGNLKSISVTTGVSTDVAYMKDKCGNNRPKSMAFDAAGTLLFVDASGTLCSAKVTNFDTTVAAYKSSIPEAGDHIWVGAAGNEYIGAPIVITYGNLRINFDANGGAALDPAYSPFYQQSILNQLSQTNSTIQLPRATRDGYTFEGWFDAANGGNKIGDGGSSYTPNSEENIQMFAQWTKNESALASTGSSLDLLTLFGAIIISVGASLRFSSPRKK